jgi:anti-sigma factor (TIGR02949 family)
MNCNESAALLQLYGDGELDAQRAAAVERHVHSCEGCAAKHSAFVELRDDIRAQAQYYTAPPRLRARVAPKVERVRRIPGWFAGAAMGCAATILAFILGSAAIDRFEDSSTVRQTVASHVQATLRDRLVVVASSDRHTVKPWLTAHLDYAAPVKDMAAEGFPLLGGRVDTLDGRDVAVLVYGYRDHRIGVYVRPHAGFDVLPEVTVERGFNVVHARRNRMEWWAVSDLSAPQLRDFVAELMRED